MVNIDTIRDYMRSQAEIDRKRKWIEVEGEDLDDALLQAAIELGVSVRQLEYEIREPGKKGPFGFGKRKCIISACQILKDKKSEIKEDEIDINVEKLSEKPVDKDGEVILRLTSEGAILSVLPPSGKGKKVTEKQVFAKLNKRNITDVNHSILTELVKNADGSAVKIGEFIYNPASDPIISVEITDFEMKCFISIRPPGKGGADIDFYNIMNFLKNNNVIHGINEDRLMELEKYPVYDSSILIAEGTKAINGNDAKIIYNFDTDRSTIKLKEKNGRVDFKEQNLIKNVVEGQALARKVPYEDGQSGRTVTGRLLPAKDGKDIIFEVGKNVRLSEDGMTAIAAINGQVLTLGEKLSVEPIYVVPGDVNLKTGGNVTFLGTVLVKGSVADGFKVKAAGNIEVMGNVGKAELDAEGDIIVHQGVSGKNGGFLRAGKSVWSKFLENANVDAGEIVLASDGIINCKVDANKKIICQGKRATIVGGVLRAAEDIHAKSLGSVAGSDTVLEVGFDPKSKKRLVELNEKMEALEKELEELNLNINTIKNLGKIKKKIPDEKKEYMKELLIKQSEIEKNSSEIIEEKEEIEEYLSSLSVSGHISSSFKVFPGVKIHIKDAYLEVKNEFKAVTFINENGLVQITKYEELEEDYSKKN
ncbi:MAG: FapA family protein [Spirochaetaceae bacterium]|nr:FapA family protein [Spirochaetaceae bacterium]